MKISKINLSEIDGFKIGNAESPEKGTGCTVIICENGAVAGVDVRGGAPATRETDLLRSENTVESINAVVLSGGSAFGLEAASGVMNELSDRGIGFRLGDITVPIVCAASLFDLAVGDGKAYPDKEMGRQACRNAYEGIFSHGNSGAGTGASVGKFNGMNKAMKTGLGVFACADEHLQLGAISAVNAVGDVYNGAGNIIAGMRNEEGSGIYGTINYLKSSIYADKPESQSDEDKFKIDLSKFNDDKLRTKSEIAAAIRNAFGKKDKDEDIIDSDDNPETYERINSESINSESPEDIYASLSLSDTQSEPEPLHESSYAQDSLHQETETVPGPESEHESSYASETLQQEIEAATDAEAETVSEKEPEDLGYDIPFNTTISCLITNAKLTKSQCNKLASILHDAYARAIKPVHGTMDGDTIFVLTSAKQEVNFDAFAALATDVMQYAIIDAAISSESAYGLPAANDIIR